MKRFDPLAFLGGLAALIAFGLLGFPGEGLLGEQGVLALGLILLTASAIASLRKRRRRFGRALTASGTVLVAAALIVTLPAGSGAQASWGFVAAMLAVWLGAWANANPVIAPAPARAPLPPLAHPPLPLLFRPPLL